MNIMIRADASIRIGSGHVMRCLALADLLKDIGAEVSFMCFDLKGNLCDLIEKTGFKVHRMFHDGYDDNFQPAYSLDDRMNDDAKHSKDLLGETHDIDWLIVDHYSLDEKWEIQMRPYVKNIMVIDDLADRHHDCDVLLDQNFYQSVECRYVDLVPEQCRKLLGPHYALLRREFLDARKIMRERNGDIHRILIFFGSSDMSNETSKVLHAIHSLNSSGIAVDVIVGINNSHTTEIKAITKLMPRTQCYFGMNNVAELMSNADLYIGAAGITTWERCCLGLPSFVITVAQNQVEATRDMAKANVLYYIGESDNVKRDDVANILTYFLMNPDIVKQYSRNSLKLVDGLGAQRCSHILSDCLNDTLLERYMTKHSEKKLA